MRKYFYPAGLIGISIIGFFLRYLYIDWGYPFFFHPDENNITNAIMKLSWTSWNPHFFAYGGLPLYAAFIISSLIEVGNKSFATTAYTLRCISALFSFLIIPSLFFIGNKLFGRNVGFTSALFASVGIGFIQFAHFGTFEMWLTLSSLWFFYFCYILWKYHDKKNIYITGLIAGILMSIKVSSIIFLPIPLVLIALQQKSITNKLRQIMLYILLVVGVYAITNPFLFLDTKSFIGSLAYESSVALGILPVFYTQSFLHTIPVMFQLEHVLPFLLNPMVFTLFLFSLFPFLYVLFKKKNKEYTLLFLFFLITFFSQAELFVKWTRYIVPTLPFIYLMLAVSLQLLTKKIQIIITITTFIVSFLLAIAFVHMVYPLDSRIAANVFIGQHLTKAKAIVEPYDLGAIAFMQTLPQTKISNIYDLETNPAVTEQLQKLLHDSTIFLSPSQRLIHTRLADPIDFPEGNKLYTQLFTGALGYHLVYQTPCDLWCTILYAGNPIQGSSEETASVFDHPFVTIFSKK